LNPVLSLPLKAKPWKNTIDKSIIKRRYAMDNIKIQGVLTSRIEKRGNDEIYYYGFFKLENQNQEIPVIFKTKPDLKKGSQVLLQGN